MWGGLFALISMLMDTKRFLPAICVAMLVSLPSWGQGENVGMGLSDADYQSISSRLFNLEKKSEKFNLYLNYAFGTYVTDESGEWLAKVKGREQRLEVTGNLTERIFYRLRHRLNYDYGDKQLQDNFSVATDLLWVGYRLTPKIDIMAGKQCKAWGGFEFDANPMFVYEYSDFVGSMDIFEGGVTLSYRPVPRHEFVFQLIDTHSRSFSQFYGEDVRMTGGSLTDTEAVGGQSRFPFTYILNWNGNFLSGRLQTRWAAGVETQTRTECSKVLSFGQKVDLPKFSFALDYMAEWDDMDMLGIATADLLSSQVANVRAGKVFYGSWIAKADWRFAEKWNLMMKGTWENVSMTDIEALGNYRTSHVLTASIEYYPDKSQDLHFFLGYAGHRVGFKAASGLDDISTNRIELGFMYRLKAF